MELKKTRTKFIPKATTIDRSDKLGQAGIDRAVLDAAIELGIDTVDRLYDLCFKRSGGK